MTQEEHIKELEEVMRSVARVYPAVRQEMELHAPITIRRANKKSSDYCTHCEMRLKGYHKNNPCRESS